MSKYSDNDCDVVATEIKAGRWLLEDAANIIEQLRAERDEAIRERDEAHAILKDASAQLVEARAQLKAVQTLKEIV